MRTKWKRSLEAACGRHWPTSRQRLGGRGRLLRWKSKTSVARSAVRMVVGSLASPVVVSGASGKGIPKAAATLPVGWRGACGGMQGQCRGNSD